MKKFIIKKDKEPLSAQEIQQQMNFDKFISGYTPLVKGWLSGGAKLYLLIASTSVVLIVAGYSIYSSVKKNKADLTPFVSSPFHALDTPSDTFALNTDADSTIIYSTGTLITVPQNAFTDIKGNDVKGNVQIHFREFHDPVDILLSGIPMNYDSAGIVYQLESAGMFEITATKNGQPVILKPGKSLLVNMISHTNNSTDYNIYNLDTVQKKWNYISENTSQNKTCISIFEDNFSLNKSGDNGISSVKKPILPKKINPAADNFSIDFNTDEFPELAVYSGLKFEPVRGEKKYNAALSKKVWEDVLIERQPDNEHYIITFTSGKESHRFTVTPVVDEKDYAAAMKDFAFRQKQYEALLAEKKKNSSLKNDSLYRINSQFKGLVLQNNLNERFNNFINDNYMGASKDLLAYRTFSVSKLGIWNSDRPIPFFTKNFTTVSGDHAAEFVTRDNQPLFLKNVYLIRRSLNSINEISQNHFDHFPFYPGAADIMVGITDDNQLVYLKDEELKASETSGKNIRFKMNKADAGIVSAKQLKDLLKI